MREHHIEKNATGRMQAGGRQGYGPGGRGCSISDGASGTTGQLRRKKEKPKSSGGAKPAVG